MTDVERAQALLQAYIVPNTPVTEAEIAAFSAACGEEARALAEADVPENVSMLRIGDYEVHTRGIWRISETARAILENAGLLRRSLPQARRR